MRVSLLTFDGAMAAAVVVAAVLLVAGVLKLSRPIEWRSEAKGLGVPALVASVVPLVEIALGAALVVQWHRQVMAWVAVALFAAFSALLVLRLAQGQRPPCACFGSLSSRPIGPWNVVRNLGFIAIAVLAATL